MNAQPKSQWAWAMYDWANSAFATTVMAGFFPIFLARYWAADLPDGERTYWLGWAGSIASLAVMLLAPLLGGIADRRGLKKRFLFFSTLLGGATTCALCFVPQGGWQAALTLFTLASVGFFAGTSFYDSLLVNVADAAELDRASSLGYGLGYLGGGLLFAVNVAMALKPDLFGISDAATATRLSFLSAGLWWMLFALPLFWFVPERADPQAKGSDLAALWATLKELRTQRPVWLFLLAYWLYIDGVDTIIRMAVDYGIKLGFASSALITALLMVQFIGFPAALAYGRLAGRIGVKPAILSALAVYATVTAGAYFMQTEAQFYAMAAIIALVQGGVQALSRSLYAQLIPAGGAGQYFGFYNMLGKFAAVGGPLAIGFTAAAFPDDQRLSILALLPFFFVGGILLARVPTEEIRRNHSL